MAKYRITAPDGNSYEITAPDDATEEQVMAYAQQNYKQPAQPDFSNVTSGSSTRQSAPARKQQGRAGYDWQNHERMSRREFTPQEVEAMNPLERTAYGFQESFDRVGRGAQQLGAAALDYVMPQHRGVAGLISGQPQSRYQSLQQDEARHREAVAPVMDTGAAKAGAFAGDATMVLAAPAKIAQLGRVGKYAASAATGAAFAGAQPVTADESRATNTALGAGLGLLGQAGGDVLMASGRTAAAKITPELRSLYEKAKAAGINLTPAQLSNSEFVKRMATQLGKLPLSGGRALAEKQQAAGNKELARLIGQKADSVTPAVLNNAAREIGQKFDDAFAGGMKYDRQFLREVAALKQEAAGLDDTAQNALTALIKRVQAQGHGGNLTGRTLQSLDQQARRWASGGGDRQLVSQAFRESLHEAFGRQAPQGVKQTWDAARRQWATLKTLEPVVARNTEGGIPLAQLQGAVNTTKAGRTMRARGKDGDLGVLASVGQRTKAPNTSGTAENLMAANAFNPLAWGPLGLASLGGLATRGTLNNAGLAPLLMREGRGQMRQAVSPYVRPTAISLFGVPMDAPVDGPRRP